jgi:hypothetical protein
MRSRDWFFLLPHTPQNHIRRPQPTENSPTIMDPKATAISIAGFCNVGVEHDGEVVITDCEQTQVDETGSEQVTYVPNMETQLRFIPESKHKDDVSQSGTGTYIPAWNYCNDVWSDPPTTTISGNNPFFGPKASASLRRQMSHIQGPTIDRLALISAKVGPVIATSRHGTVTAASPVHATTYNFGVVPNTGQYSVCDSMGPAAQGVEIIRRKLEALSDKM